MTPARLTDRALDQQKAAMRCEWSIDPSPDSGRWLVEVRCDGELFTREERRTMWAARRLAWSEMARAGEAWRRTRVTANP